MAIQPIDLQTMYAQIQNVAKEAAFHEQGVKLADAMQQADVIEQNKEKAQRVKETSKASVVNEDGRSSESGERKKKKDKNSADTGEENAPRLKESYLGQHIDIMR